MASINQRLDIGYLFSLKGTILPIRPIQVDQNINRKGIKYKKGKILYIHDEIIRYYILKGYIKNAEHLLNASPFQLFCGLSDLKLTVMIRAMHQFQVFLPEYITKNLADTIQNIELQLNESIRAIARAHQIDDHYETETFPDFKTAIKTINAAYQQKKEEEKRR